MRQSNTGGNEVPLPHPGTSEGAGATVARASGSQPGWYLDAVLYDVLVRAFADGNGDGIGDFPGLTGRLEYVRDLGVTAVCLAPFFPSPLRDGGYDITDHTAIHPSHGTIDDFLVFLAAAHRLDLRVVIELVVNHTSDQHPWFLNARRASPGSPERDVYLWSDTNAPYSSVRAIHTELGSSNWTWDPVANAFYWHRFHAHEPDLNFDNPDVCERMLWILDFWFAAGVDGIKLAGAPYLYERDGTACEHLPETHAFLRRVRAHVDGKFTDRLLMVEPEASVPDSVGYFGEGDECHVCLHDPLSRHVFLALRAESGVPIADTIKATPPIPEGCRWAFRLRGLDELSPDAAADAERSRVDGQSPATHLRPARGFVRRLAPMVGNDRRRIELLNTLLFSLPGIPVLYYGDEIGMGDNPYLKGRVGVQTPMQWNDDRNAGFSFADPSRLYAPVVMGAEYSYETLNVDVQQESFHSLLRWTTRMVALRKGEATFAAGPLKVIDTDNSQTIVFVRASSGKPLLIAANLSASPQVLRCNLVEYAGMAPCDLFGRTTFPDISDKPYFLSLTPYACLMFALEGVPTLYHSCFISYSTLDTAFAERLHADLSFKGVNCWFAPEDVKIGDRFRQRIHDSIRSHDKLLLILSEHSIRSPWVEDEVESAFATERREGRLLLFPVRIDDAVMKSSEAWAESLRNARHIGDFRHWKEHDRYVNSFGRLLRDLKAESA